MSFMFYDIGLLVLFVIFISFFLYKKRKNLGREGSLVLYRTKWGIKLIDYFGDKYKKTLKVLSFFSIGIGYFLMAGMLYFIIQSVYLYLTTPIAQIIKAPPIAPLIPYFPELFGLESFFPPFYFVYFIVAILIVASVHEFSHGIFARRFGIKIKSTGFAFLRFFPAFFGAFVEQDDKQMKKSNKFAQMSVLSAGVFANIIITILFYALLFGFFSVAFTASGVAFDSYSYSVVETNSITSINGIPITNFSQEDLTNKTKIKVLANGKEYIAIDSISLEEDYILLYDSAPAINNDLSPVISEINGVKIDDINVLENELNKYSPGEKVIITSITKEGEVEKEIVLESNPNNNESAWLGIGFANNEPTGFVSKFLSFVPSYKKPYVYYESKCKASEFVKDFLWWIVIINLLVALFNMLPLGFLDGGRFFYLTFLGLTGSKKVSEKMFKGMTIFIVLLFVVLMAKWTFGFF